MPIGWILPNINFLHHIFSGNDAFKLSNPPAVKFTKWTRKNPFRGKHHELIFANTKLYTTPMQECTHTSILALHICDLRPWSSWTANSDKKLNVNKPCVTSRKRAFRKFCKIFCQFSRCHKFW